MSRMLQIREDDLATLESVLPQLADRLSCAPNVYDSRVKTQIRRIKMVLSDVRWNYGPYETVEVIPAQAGGE